MENSKIIEIMSASKIGWENAAEKAINKAHTMWPDTKTFCIIRYNATVKGNRIVEYKVTAWLGFETGKTKTA